MRILSVPSSILNSVLNPVSDLIHDSDFTGTDGTLLSGYTPLVGNPFTLIDGGWQLSGNKVTTVSSPAPSAGQYIAMTDAEQPDVKVTIVCSLNGAAQLGLWMRSNLVTVDDLVYVGFAHADDINGMDFSITVYNFVDTVLQSTVVSGVAGATNILYNTDFTVDVTYADDLLTVGMNGVDYITDLAMPTSQEGTNFGFSNVGGSAGDIKVGDFKMYSRGEAPSGIGSAQIGSSFIVT